MNIISKNTEAKINAGEDWKYHFTMDNDVAKALMKDIKKHPYGVAVNIKLNEILRKAFRLKKKK